MDAMRWFHEALTDDKVESVDLSFFSLSKEHAASERGKKHRHLDFAPDVFVLGTIRSWTHEVRRARYSSTSARLSLESEVLLSSAGSDGIRGRQAYRKADRHDGQRRRVAGFT